MSYHMLKRHVPYRELGMDYLDKRRKDKITKSYIRRLTEMGFEVTIKEAT
ncbi:MAG: hypothetical protein AB1552_14465 [Nitrospirota bacterium]